jgi:hypothetical protein
LLFAPAFRFEAGPVFPALADRRAERLGSAADRLRFDFFSPGKTSSFPRARDAIA